MNAWNTVRNLWYAGNYWVRWAILIAALWPIAIAVAALTGWTFLTAVIALIPFVAIVFGLIATFDPLVIAAAGTSASGRKILTAAAAIIGAELAVGVFFSVVPVANNPGLIPLTLLTMVALVFLALSGTKGRAVAMLTLVLIGITAMFFFPKTSVSVVEAKARIDQVMADTVSGKEKSGGYPICAETAAGVKVTLAKPEAEVKLNSKCRSGWVELPNNGPRYHVRITSPGDLEIVFWDGRPPMLVGATESVWEGRIKNQTFRLRGEGEAKIILEPFSSAKPATTAPRSKVSAPA